MRLKHLQTILTFLLHPLSGPYSEVHDKNSYKNILFFFAKAL